METFKELRQAIEDEKTLVWNDPDPLENGDYIITFVENLDSVDDHEDPSGYPILIQYGFGSEAEVLLSEIELYDLFEDYENHPPELIAVLENFDLEELDYDSCAELVTELEKIGYTCEYGLDAQPYELKKL